MRFAYLIMAHDNQNQLKILLKSLDYSENDIYLHIDKKCTCLRAEKLLKIVNNASLHIYSKYKVYWADVSQTKCQFFLLKEATKTFHDYYHLLSGHDLLLKSHDYIQDFFSMNRKNEFVHFQFNSYKNKSSCSYFHFLFPIIQRTKSTSIKSFLRIIEKKSISFQKKIGVNRLVYYGANWFSVTHGFALELLSKKKPVLRKLAFTVSSDECVLQMFIKNFSHQQYKLYCEKENDYHSISREIDWDRGNPYVWRTQDYDYLINSDMCFARKFDENVDFNIICKIAERIGVSLDECSLDT